MTGSPAYPTTHITRTLITVFSKYAISDCGIDMLNHELIKQLQQHPADLPILMKISQELQGLEDNFSWMRGEVYNVFQEELYLDPRQGEGGGYVNRDQLSDAIDNDPEAYLGDGSLEWGDTQYDNAKENFMDDLNWEKVLVIDIKP